MRICFICSEYPPAPHGGIGTFVLTLGQALVKLGQEVKVVGYDSRVENTAWSDVNGVKVLRLRSPFRSLPQLALGRYQFSLAFWGERFYLSRIIRDLNQHQRFDMLENHDWSGPLWSKPMSPMVTRFHGANSAQKLYLGGRISRILKFVERRNVMMADALVAVSRHSGINTLKALEVKNRDFMLIYNGVDTNVFRPLPGAEDPHEVMYLGRMHRGKGICAFLRAIPNVVRQVPQAHFTVAGRLPEGEKGEHFKAHLLSLIPESCHQKVRFVGYVPFAEVPSWYARAAVTVFPAYFESCPMAWLEAMASGAAAVITRRASGPEIVEDGVSGLLADPDDPEEMARAICRLLADESLRREIGANSRKRAVECFDLARLAEKNLRFYREVAGGFRT